MKTRQLHILFLIFVSAILTSVTESCSTSKHPVKSSSELSDGLRRASDAKAKLNGILASYEQWERMSMPVSIRLKSPQNASISGNAIFERDKSVFISLRFLGFEVGNIYATNDSIFVIDKYNKQFIAEDIRQFLGDTPINVANVQNLLTGHIFVLGETSINISTLSESADIEVTSSTSWSLIPDKQPKGTEYGFAFSPANTLQLAIIKSNNHQPVTITYSSPVDTKMGPISSLVGITYQTDKNKLDAEINWSPEKAKWDSDVQLRQPSISSKYSRITIDKITLMLSKF